MHCAGWLRARCGAVARTGRRVGRLRAWGGAAVRRHGAKWLLACGCGHAAAGTLLRARGFAHVAASKGQGSCALGARLRRGRGLAAARTQGSKRLRARGSAHAAARTHPLLRAQNKATARTGRGGCSNVAGRRRAQGARRGAATRMCISQNAAINCNLMCILKFSNVCFSNHRMLSKGYDTFNCNQMCILKFISRACVYVHTRKVRLLLTNEASISRPHLS